jgi:sugar transferase (PEP-CTERM/EpsH1 system associated)
LVRGTSLSVPYFHSGRLAGWVDRVLREQRPDAAFLYSSVMGQYLPDRPALRPGRVVMDFVDVDSVKWQQYAAMRPWPLRALYAREYRRLLAFDRTVAARCDAGLFVSAPEAALFRRLAPEVAARIHAIPNGIDHTFFTADPGMASPFPAGIRAIVMTGAMDYWPNVDAAQWYADTVFPQVLARYPEARFVVVGSNPSASVLRLGARPGLVVTGRVPDVRPYLAHAALVVAPVRVARGLQNKVLEGMAMGRVVITTPQGIEGISARPGDEVVVCADSAGFVAATLDALGGAPALAGMGRAARARILADFDWSDKLRAYDRLLRGEAPAF